VWAVPPLYATLRSFFSSSALCRTHCLHRTLWFCSLKGNEFFAQVDREFIQDDFNLTGLSSLVPHYEEALDTILDVEMNPRLSRSQQDAIETSAELLYGLIHARYILSPRGMQAMLEKYKHVHFGRCPRVHCQGQPALPVGQSDLPRVHTTKIFCCRCEDIYYPRSARQANVDGAYFGTTFCHLFMQTFFEMRPPPPETSYVPRIYGFKIHRPESLERERTASGRGAAGRSDGGPASADAGSRVGAGQMVSAGRAAAFGGEGSSGCTGGSVHLQTAGNGHQQPPPQPPESSSAAVPV
jgi:hypothetical protein